MRDTGVLTSIVVDREFRWPTGARAVLEVLSIKLRTFPAGQETPAPAAPARKKRRRDVSAPVGAAGVVAQRRRRQGQSAPAANGKWALARGQAVMAAGMQGVDPGAVGYGCVHGVAEAASDGSQLPTRLAVSWSIRRWAPDGTQVVVARGGCVPAGGSGTPEATLNGSESNTDPE
mmetsp:Transcript_46759/g.117832  ORF Transcript_46759/g.117832 Transcript_46759/m.117832 type:complete len:175 (-) Transcript_46759:65-589(-)